MHAYNYVDSHVNVTSYTLQNAQVKKHFTQVIDAWKRGVSSHQKGSTQELRSKWWNSKMYHALALGILTMGSSTNRNKYLVRDRKRRCKRSFLGVKKFAGLPNLEKDQPTNQPTNQRTNFKYAIKRKSLARMLDGHSWEDMHQESTKQGPICYILYPISSILYPILSYPILSYILSHISS